MQYVVMGVKDQPVPMECLDVFDYIDKEQRGREGRGMQYRSQYPSEFWDTFELEIQYVSAAKIT